MKLKIWKSLMPALLAAVMLVASVGCGSVKVNKPTTSGDTSTGSSVENGSVDDTQSTSDASSQEQSEASTLESSTAGSTGSGTKGTTAGGSTGNNTTAGSSSFKEPVYNLGGRVITIAWENSVPNRKEKSIFNESLTLTEKKYNCTFKFIQKSDYAGLYQKLILDRSAETATYDVVALRGYDVWPNAANSGAILELDKYYDFAKDPTWQVDAFKKVGTFKNHWVGIPYSPNEMGTGLFYNKALFRKFGATDPWEYVNKGTWNWNTFRALCKKLTHDTNGDGKPDYWAYTSEDPWLAFISANGGSMMTTTSNGSPKFALDSKASLEAIQFISDLHLVDNTVPDGKELGAITNSPFNAMTTGKVAMFNYHARYGAVLEAYGIASSDIGWVYMPKGPSATGYSASSSTMPEMFVIPRYAKAPKELVAAVQDLAAYWDSSRTIKHGIYDKTEELYQALKSSLNANAKKVLYYQAQHPDFTYTANYSVGITLQNDLWPMILSQKKNVKTAVASFKSQIQTELTKKYNGTVVS